MLGFSSLVVDGMKDLSAGGFESLLVSVPLSEILNYGEVDSLGLL